MPQPTPPSNPWPGPRAPAPDAAGGRGQKREPKKRPR